MRIRVKVVNNLGTYISEEYDVTDEKYNELVESSKGFWYTEPSFHIWTENGIVIFPPEIASKSILLIEII